MIKIIKKDGCLEDYNIEKVVKAVKKSAERVLVNFTDEQLKVLCDRVNSHVENLGTNKIEIGKMHSIVEEALDSLYPTVAKSYRDYRNYKIDFVSMLDQVYKKSQSIMYIGDKENSNLDSSIVSTKRSLIFNALNKELYKKFFLNKDELQAIRDGYIYIHDMTARRDTMNCCLFDVEKVLNGGFEMGNIWYNEPKTLEVAFDVIGDIVLSAASQQYGGFTIQSVDKLLAPFAEKTYLKQLQKYKDLGLCEDIAKRTAMQDTKTEAEKGFQGWEYKFNTVASSRGDYPFITTSCGLETSVFGKMITLAHLNVREGGQGKVGNKKPVLFPKIVFLYDKELHGKGKINYDLFQSAIKCSSKSMYPDYLSLTGKGYVCDIYKKYKTPISPMGCRAFLSPWFERGGMYAEDENDKPIFVGRFNIGAVSLHLPLIYAKAQRESKPFYEVLDYYLELIRQLHIRTYEYLGQMRASVNPLAYCQGGFLGGNLNYNDKIEPLLKSATASFGITALNELQQIYNHKSIAEDGEFALETLKYINKKIEEYKEIDHNLYAIYGTPAESLCGLQITQFRKLYGNIKNVSDREYVSNSFHCHVSEDLTPFEKQEKESRFWNYCNGGKIQHSRFFVNYNLDAIESVVTNAMELGFYEAVNFALSYCDDCGHSQLNMEECPKCHSKNLTKIDRMNGYLSYSRVKGDTRLNNAKMHEIKDRKSM